MTNNNEKRKLRELLAAAATSSIILPVMKEAIWMIARRIDLTIIDVSGNQR